MVKCLQIINYKGIEIQKTYSKEDGVIYCVFDDFDLIDCFKSFVKAIQCADYEAQRKQSHK